MSRIESWEQLDDRSQYDYAALPDDDLMAMQKTARAESATFLVDGRAMFIEVMRKSGLAAVNDEMWKRGLTPAQRKKEDKQ